MLEIWHNNEWATIGTGDFLTLVRNEKNQAEHALSFSVSADMDDDVAYAKGDRVALRNNGSIEFVGTIREKTRTKHSVTFKAVNVWWYFLNITHEVDWAFVATAYSASHVTLCRDENGDEQTAGWQIQKAIDRAIDQGASALFNTDDLDLLNVLPPTDEAYDLTCAEVIKKMLRWYPNTAIVFEYPTDPDGGTTIRFLRSDSAETVALSTEELPALSVAETETLVNGVKIVYEVTSAIINGETTTIIEDTAGIQTGPGVMVLTKDVHDGSYVESTDWSNTYSMYLSTTALPSPWYNDWSWISSQKWFNTSSVCQMNSASPMNPPYSRYVISGWQEGFGLTSQMVNFVFSFRMPSTSGNCSSGYYNSSVSFWLRLTNATTGTYTRTDTGTNEEVIPGEAMPDGAAGQLLLACGGQIYSGSTTLDDPENRISRVGAQRININGGEVGWESMLAVVQTLKKNYMNDAVQFSFGRESHLTPDDFISFLTLGRQISRPNRDR